MISIISFKYNNLHIYIYNNYIVAYLLICVPIHLCMIC